MKPIAHAIALAMLSLAAAPAFAQDVTAGEKTFAQCKLCHAVGEKARNGIGPQLNGIVGRPAGASPGYAYSAAVKGSGIVWDEAKLRQFIADPKAMIPDTKMPFEGIKDEGQVADLVAYLQKFDLSGKKL